ncbi:hypothetical protein R5R35_006079 [Gryllus longicercus]|uniref:Uncharacterized protein n=1 Tax=Gryllus longicercus TaxID=2509291 RepID=A0AAN9WDB3_9ORTH
MGHSKQIQPCQLWQSWSLPSSWKESPSRKSIECKIQNLLEVKKTRKEASTFKDMWKIEGKIQILLGVKIMS